MSVFVWPAPFGALAKCNQHGIDKNYGPTGHSGCAEASGLTLASGTETYIQYLDIVAYAGAQKHGKTQ